MRWGLEGGQDEACPGSDTAAPLAGWTGNQSPLRPLRTTRESSDRCQIDRIESTCIPGLSGGESTCNPLVNRSDPAPADRHRKRPSACHGSSECVPRQLPFRAYNGVCQVLFAQANGLPRLDFCAAAGSHRPSCRPCDRWRNHNSSGDLPRRDCSVHDPAVESPGESLFRHEGPGLCDGFRHA